MNSVGLSPNVCVCVCMWGCGICFFFQCVWFSLHACVFCEIGPLCSWQIAEVGSEHFMKLYCEEQLVMMYMHTHTRHTHAHTAHTHAQAFKKNSRPVLNYPGSTQRAQKLQLISWQKSKTLQNYHQQKWKRRLSWWRYQPNLHDKHTPDCFLSPKHHPKIAPPLWMKPRRIN